MPHAWNIEWCRAVPTRFAALWLLAIPAVSQARAPITAVPFKEGQTRIEAIYQDPKSQLAKVVFQCGPDSSGLPVYVNVLRRRGESRLTRLLGQLDLPVREVGITVPRTDQRQDVFYRAEADSGDRGIREIGLVVPWSFERISLRVARNRTGAPRDERRPSSNFDDPLLRDERDFLLGLEQAGLATPGAGRVIPAAPATAGAAAAGFAPGLDSTASTAGSRELDVPALFREWMSANDAIVSGRMQVKRVPGLPPSIGDVTDSLRMGDVIVTAHFQSGVLASDRREGTSWALFHPHARDAWPTAMVIAGRWLVIGTRGEGLACVDPRTFDLRRMPLDPPYDRVVTIATRGDSVVINGLRPVALPLR